MKFGERMKAIRESKLLSLKKTADSLGVSPQRYSSWERDISNPNIDYIIDICKVLGITLEEFFGVSKDDLPKHANIDILKEYNSLDEEDKVLVQNLVYGLKKNKINRSTKHRTFVMPFLSADEHPDDEFIELPYFQDAAGAGRDRFVDLPLESKIELKETSVPDKADFVIRVSGDSMEPAFNSGDLLFIEATDYLRDGEVGLFNYRGEELVKIKEEGELRSLNPNYKPIALKDDCYIQGRVLGKVQ